MWHLVRAKTYKYTHVGAFSFCTPLRKWRQNVIDAERIQNFLFRFAFLLSLTHTDTEWKGGSTLQYDKHVRINSEL